jgi:hypothetical protein
MWQGKWRRFLAWAVICSVANLRLVYAAEGRHSCVPPAPTVCRCDVRLTRRNCPVSPTSIWHAFTCPSLPAVVQVGIATRQWFTNCGERLRQQTVRSVCVAARLLAAGSGFRMPARTKDFSLLQKSRPGVRLPTHLHVVLKLRIIGAIPPLPPICRRSRGQRYRLWPSRPCLWPAAVSLVSRACDGFAPCFTFVKGCVRACVRARACVCVCRAACC